jgi:ABC-type sugar transport system ATPase subunit
MLQINDLNMSAGNFSVNNINLSVPDGCCHALLGGTGNGKTLILESIAGLRPIKSGEILVDERNITKEFPENRFISYVPQDLALFPHLNVEQNIFYSKRFKKSQGRNNEEIQEIIKRLQIEDIMHRSIKNLSGGEQQRVALARAFASGNKVLLLDEPFSALHSAMKRTLWNMLLDIQKRYKLSILMVTHDLEEASFLADYVSILHNGRILQTGTKKDVFKNPAHIEVTK